MKLSDEEVKDILAIQKRLTDKISAYKKEIRLLEQNWSVLNRIVSESSFTSAADMLESQQEGQPTPEQPERGQEEPSSQHDYAAATAAVAATAAAAPQHVPEPTQSAHAGREPFTQIRDGGTSMILADVYKTEDAISIEITYDGDAALTEESEPFRSFFLEKILGGMRKEDEQNAVAEEDAINYEIASDPGTGRMQSIRVENYRDERRAGEIISTAGWSLTKMLGGSAAAATAGS